MVFVLGCPKRARDPIVQLSARFVFELLWAGSNQAWMMYRKSAKRAPDGAELNLQPKCCAPGRQGLSRNLTADAKRGLTAQSQPCGFETNSNPVSQ
jgi:hypothetical protein